MPTSPHVRPVHLAARPGATGERRTGVLLCHGFTGSTASVRPWAEHLAAQGYGVRAPRLPGHGTRWRDLDATGWDDWYAEVRRGFEALAADHDAVVVGGLSMGGTLALRLAADHPGRVAGVVVVNPAVASRRPELRALPLLKRLRRSVPAIGDDIAREGVTEHGYDRTPLRALHSFVRSWPATLDALPSVTAPILYFRSTTDDVVDDASEPRILAGVSSTDVTVVRLERSRHVATLDHDAPRIEVDSAAFVARVTA